jgi:hypothetical protein
VILCVARAETRLVHVIFLFRWSEAIDILTRAVSLEPSNKEIVALLREAEVQGTFGYLRFYDPIFIIDIEAYRPGSGEKSASAEQNARAQKILSEALGSKRSHDDSCSDGIYYAAWDSDWCEHVVLVLESIYTPEVAGDLFVQIHAYVSKMNFGYSEPPCDAFPREIMSWFLRATQLDAFSQSRTGPSVLCVLLSQHRPDLDAIRTWIARPVASEPSSWSRQPMVLVVHGLVSGWLFPDADFSSSRDCFLPAAAANTAERCQQCKTLWEEMISRGLSPFEAEPEESVAMSVLQSGQSWSSFYGGGFDSTRGVYAETSAADSAAIRSTIRVSSFLQFALSC